MSETLNIRDINPLEHITSDIAKSRANYESILNGLVMWNSTAEKNVTVRLETDTYPYYVDYTFPSRAAYAKETTKFLDGSVRVNAFDYEHRLVLPAMPTDDTTLRITADSNVGATWKLYEDVHVYDAKKSIGSMSGSAYVKGSYIRLKDGNTYTMYYALTDIGETDVFTLGTNVTRAVVKWRASEAATYGNVPAMVIVYKERADSAGNAYCRKPGAFNPGAQSVDANWEFFADRKGTKAVHGKPYLYEGILRDTGDPATTEYDLGVYLYIGPTTTAASGPYNTDGELDTVNWYGPVVMKDVTDISATSVIRHKPTSDIDGYILRANTDVPGEVSVLANVAVYGGQTEPHRGLGVFNTCNYALWPDTSSPMWRQGRTYSYADSYMAKMVFHHGDEDTKMTNIINYDGPDMDRGLGIYLPVNDTVVVDGVERTVTPKDGTMFEFMFRIWPNCSLNGTETADLTINKAQIYVFSLLDGTDTEHNVNTIAKFSMARLTNFYVWSENIAIPNRPVFLKARFIFSKTDNEWKTYDYYQVPDHIFLSPNGFMSPDGEKITGYNGLETAGFPLMQDPFGGMNLGRVVLKNRIGQNAGLDESEETGDSTNDPGV